MKQAPILALACAMSFACGRQEASEKAPGVVPGKAPPSGVLEAARAERGDEKPSSDVEKSATSPLAPGERYAVSNILIAFKGAKRAPSTVTRNEDEARALADKLHGELRAGADFASLADKHSDGPERGHGGHLGIFSSGSPMVPEIAQAVTALKIGEFSEPLKSAFGIHIVKRDPVEELYLAQIVVAYAGADGTTEKVTRTREDARARAEEAFRAATAKDARFTDVVASYSDHPSKLRNGGLIGRVFRGMLPRDIEPSAFSLAPGEVSRPIDTSMGIVILRRLPEAGARHILVTYKGAQRAGAEVVRTREEAEALALDLLAKLSRGDEFARLAAESSDCASKIRGGDLGTVAEGTMTEKFERAVFSLKPGERGGVVETEFGFHIVERYR